MKKYFLFFAVVFGIACNNDKTEKSREIKQYSIDQFYKSTEVFGGSFNFDDSRLLYTSNESGIYNAWEADIVAGKNTAKTKSSQESIFSIGFVPGSNKSLYSSDKGGDENSHIYLEADDSTFKDLTPGVKEKAQFFGWSRDNKYMYYQSNARDARFMDLYKMDTSGWKAVMFYKNETGFDVAAISPDEHYLLLSEYITTTVSNLYLADQQTKQLKKINTENTNNSGLQFSLDNKSVYFLTDEGSEYTYAVKYDIGAGTKEKVYSANWDVNGLAISYNEKYRIVYVNEDGANMLHLFDHQNGKELDFPKINDASNSSINT